MSKRKAITVRMKVDTLLAQVFRQFGKHLLCPISKIEMIPGDDIQFDHIHCVELDGPHAYTNLRAVHVGPHKKKTKADLRMIKKARPGHADKFVVVKPQPTELEYPSLALDRMSKRKWAKGRKLQSRGFEKRPR